MLMKAVFLVIEGKTCQYSWPSELIQGSYKCKKCKCTTFEHSHQLKNNNLRKIFWTHLITFNHPGTDFLSFLHWKVKLIQVDEISVMVKHFIDIKKVCSNPDW